MGGDAGYAKSCAASVARGCSEATSEKAAQRKGGFPSYLIGPIFIPSPWRSDLGILSRCYRDGALPETRGQIAGAPVGGHGDFGILRRIACSSSYADTDALPYIAGRTPGCAQVPGQTWPNAAERSRSEHLKQARPTQTRMSDLGG